MQNRSHPNPKSVTTRSKLYLFILYKIFTLCSFNISINQHATATMSITTFLQRTLLLNIFFFFQTRLIVDATKQHPGIVFFSTLAFSLTTVTAYSDINFRHSAGIRLVELEFCSCIYHFQRQCLWSRNDAVFSFFKCLNFSHFLYSVSDLSWLVRRIESRLAQWKKFSSSLFRDTYKVAWSNQRKVTFHVSVTSI